MHNIFWAILILAFIATFLQMDWVYYLVYVVGGIWVFSYWWTQRSLRHLDIERKMDTHAFLGEKIEAKLQVTNRSRLPLPWVQVQETVPLDLQDARVYQTVVSVGGRSQSEIHYTMISKRRGLYPVGPLKLTTGDLFGFVNSAWQETAMPQVVVYPQVLSLQELGLPSRSPFGTLSSRQRLFDDPARIATVRDYVSGDSLRHIHWKASARENKLQVKRFQPAIALNVEIILDLNHSAYPYQEQVGGSEWAIVIAASIASAIITQRQPVGLVSNGLDPLSAEPAAPVPASTGQGHLMSILTLLARIQRHVFEPTLAEWLPGRIASLAWGTTLVVITPQLDKSGLWTLHQAYRRGSNILVLTCTQQADFKEIQAQGERLGVPIHPIIWDRDLERLGHRG